jgi:multidrug transporter EmrE-like cation transporter
MKIMNLIQRIIFGAIFNLLIFGNKVDAITVECEYEVWSAIGYSCTLKARTFSGHETITEVTGNHKSGSFCLCKI